MAESLADALALSARQAGHPTTAAPTRHTPAPAHSDGTDETARPGAGAVAPVGLDGSATVRRTNRRTGDRRGRTPYGFQWGAVGLVADPDEYPVWQAIIELGRRGHTSEEIARRLHRLDVPTRHDRIWHASTITNILRREDPTLAPSHFDTTPLPNPDRRERMRRTRHARRTQTA